LLLHKAYRMKSFKILTLLILTGILLSASCKKDKDSPESEMAKLPPETQTGANTFGALVNGKALLPSGSSIDGSPVKQCSYIYLNGGYYFNVDASRKNSSSSIDAMYIQTENLPIHANETIKLTNYLTSGKASGSYVEFLRTSQIEYRTNSTITGELHINRLDEINQVVSGTFWFDAVNTEGKKVEVRSGRFDMHFTK
jgi:hypothetical protein